MLTARSSRHEFIALVPDLLMPDLLKPPYTTELHEGSVSITLAGESVTLKPTLGAAIVINRAFGGLVEAQRRVLAQDIEAIGVVIAAGLGRSEKTESVLGEVFETGIDELVGPAGNFVAALATAGGRKKASGEGPARGKD